MLRFFVRMMELFKLKMELRLFLIVLLIVWVFEVVLGEGGRYVEIKVIVLCLVMFS